MGRLEEKAYRVGAIADISEAAYHWAFSRYVLYDQNRTNLFHVGIVLQVVRHSAQLKSHIPQVRLVEFHYFQCHVNSPLRRNP